MNLPVDNVVIDLGSVAVLAVVIAGLLYRVEGGSLHHFDRWQVVKGPARSAEATSTSGAAIRSIFVVLFREVFATKVLGTCSRLKRGSHLAIFWGFAFLGISTTLAFITNPTNVVLPLTDPVKLFGNVGGLLVVVGFILMFYVRYGEQAPIWRLTRSDVFMLTLFLTVVTGFVTQQVVYSAADPFWVSGTFWLHMVFVIVLLATAPFTKFFHAVSKPVSILHEEVDTRLGREPVLPALAVTKSEAEHN